MPQPGNCIWKIYQPAFGAFDQNSERTDHRQIALRCHTARGTIVNDESVGLEFFRQSDSFALAGAQVLSRWIGDSLDASNLEPSGRMGNPALHCLWCPRPLKLLPHGQRDQDMTIQLGQYLHPVNQN